MKKILFVCTGNTCRSPMAQAIFNSKCPDGYISDSAGISTTDGRPVSQNSLLALKDIGLDIEHTSRMITEQDMIDFDYIIGITSDHARMIAAVFPEYAQKVYAFPAEVTDPYGRNLDEYIKCRDIINNGIDAIIKELTNE